MGRHFRDNRQVVQGKENILGADREAAATQDANIHGPFIKPRLYQIRVRREEDQAYLPRHKSMGSHPGQTS